MASCAIQKEFNFRYKLSLVVIGSKADETRIGNSFCYCSNNYKNVQMMMIDGLLDVTLFGREKERRI